jgi:hypothetical protein
LHRARYLRAPQVRWRGARTFAFASYVTSGEKSELFSGVDLSEKENPG